MNKLNKSKYVKKKKISEHFPYKIEKIGAWEVHVTTAEEQNENGRMLLHMPYLNMWILILYSPIH